MKTSATLDAPCAPEVLFAHVEVLDRYPGWMSLVHTATVAEPGADGWPAWSVELRTHLGPLARSKRLRMVRTELVAGRSVRFERRELDDRRHSSWELDASVEPTNGGSRLVMELMYGGSLWTGGVLQRILDDEIGQGSARLLAIVSDPGDSRTR